MLLVEGDGETAAGKDKEKVVSIQFENLNQLLFCYIFVEGSDILTSSKAHL